MEELTFSSSKREEIIDITREVNAVVKKSGISTGVCCVYVPHATAAITVNENDDPNVCEDFLNALRGIAPKGIWKHDKIDGNADAHIKASIVGPSETIPFKQGELLLGTWQNVFLCCFDGPKKRKIIITLLPEE